MCPSKSHNTRTCALNDNKSFKWTPPLRRMGQKINRIIGVILAVIGLILLLSDIVGYKIEIPLLKSGGIFAVGFVLITIGLMIATMFSKEDDINF